MSTRFSLETDTYKATTGLPAGNVYSATCWVNIAVIRAAKATVWALADSSTEGAAGANTLLITYTDGVSIRLESFGAITSSYTMTADTWYQLGVVVNGANATLYYAPAATALTAVTVSTFTPPATNGGLWIGRSVWNGEWLNGRIAAFKMWDAALTQYEIEAELASWDAVRTANLLRVHKFQTAETTDYSGLGNTLTGGIGATTDASDPPISTGPPPVMERFAPDAILAQTGLTGAVTAIQDDPDSPDGSWLVG